jgi:hypothetical protein
MRRARLPPHASQLPPARGQSASAAEWVSSPARIATGRWLGRQTIGCGLVSPNDRTLTEPQPPQLTVKHSVHGVAGGHVVNSRTNDRSAVFASPHFNDHAGQKLASSISTAANGFHLSRGFLFLFLFCCFFFCHRPRRRN